MKYERMPIEIESPEALGYDSIECNLAESSVSDVVFKEINLNINELFIAYGDHKGKPELRTMIASQHELNAEDVLLTVGAAGALFIIQTSLLTAKDHLIVLRPNYATNIETPRAIGCEISFADLKFEENFELNIEKIRSLIQSNTKLISITTPHNPTGTMVSEKTIIALCKLAEEINCLLLVDETYRELSFSTPTSLAAAISKNALSVSSVSKAYGIPGIRMGWIITQNKILQHLFLAAKEQIHICNSVVDEEICFQYLLKKEKYFPAIQSHIKTCFNILEKWMEDHPQLEWIKPSGGVVCFPQFRDEIKIDVEKFYKILLEKYKTYIGPGHWFEMSKRSFRLGFGWEIEINFIKGLKNIDKAISESIL
jgi:aspartate/methionine/tyrosine aminotransferase